MKNIIAVIFCFAVGIIFAITISQVLSLPSWFQVPLSIALIISIIASRAYVLSGEEIGFNPGYTALAGASLFIAVYGITIYELFWGHFAPEVTAPNHSPLHYSMEAQMLKSNAEFFIISMLWVWILPLLCIADSIFKRESFFWLLAIIIFTSPIITLGGHIVLLICWGLRNLVRKLTKSLFSFAKQNQKMSFVIS